ncbi:hypothetical protein LOTGIDRAFT_61096, partial [Lottia gigantea]
EITESDYICYCVPGFTGRNCQVNIDECTVNPCQQDGLCIDGINNYFCACMKG